MTLKFHWYLPTHGDTTTVADNRLDAATRLRTHLQPTLENLTELGRVAEGYGFEAVLTPTGTHCEDSWIATAALAQHTERLKYLVAFRPGVLSPTAAAQQVGTYQRFTGNRLALNVVTGGDDDEMRRFGDWADKAARYRRTGEFLTVLRGLWNNPEFSFHGEFYRIERAALAYPLEHVPTIYFGGSSPEAIEVAAQHADVYLTWCEPPEQVAEKIERVRAAAARHGRTLRYGVRLHTVARPTAEEAWQRAAELMTGLTPEAVRSAHERYLASGSEGQRRMAALTSGELVGVRELEVHPGLWAGPSLLRDGAGTAAVGCYADVAALFGEYIEVGATEFVLSGYPQRVEIHHVGKGVLPLFAQAPAGV
ncbi:luciferase-like monooxygenase family protein [Mycolicibacterium hassiacum DSM 44199]|uniref:Luciferase-like monooxygenase family protein n=1 Tax=Mycolicibacterium hassiacum (strain DSM 44199 / CIP 105218 / JCM 12690 / 3849) TaxID=1122247 RepID=K5BAZ8_MYCHD|nr:LLM class flavin-dependent oxidoreductase [Mycolicibacterium hassiacum]EKF23115.1 luciferase-like monooxygenase family protein [Mycolicibacterium hassiacum DSM 44199]MDA4086493.1 alkanesulfonate monooxygenase [Mycolicibacterium hassiacum DSM 44199]VCT89606.1 Methanesulfonate monooxygenase [Mycolicibacterium hassiacum DSM 44199]